MVLYEVTLQVEPHLADAVEEYMRPPGLIPRAGELS